MKIFVYAVVLLVLCFALAFASATIRDGSLQATSDGNDVTISWGTGEESNMVEFDVERKGDSNGSDFVKLTPPVRPTGSNSYYTFVDRDAFKTTVSVYHYQIMIVSTDGVSYSKVVSVSHNVSSVKRTWGSLKAMFR